MKKMTVVLAAAVLVLTGCATNEPERFNGVATVTDMDRDYRRKNRPADFDILVCQDVNVEDTCWWEDVSRGQYGNVQVGQQVTFENGEPML